MPLPDAKPDRRIYELLKTTDLENLTFSDFQKVAQTIYTEQGAEDELRRIVLVNLARLSVAGEWTGLTSAGGGGASTFAIPSGVSSVSYGTSRSGYGQFYADVSTSTRNASDYNTPKCFPMIAQRDGAITSMTIRCTTAGTGTDFLVGIYADSNGAPGALIGSATFDLAATGYITQTSFSATITLEAGTAYWIGFGNTGGAGSEAVRRISTPSVFGIVENDSDESPYQGWTHSGTATSLPSTFVATAGTYFRPLCYYS
jgi:hypothetical protein